MNLFQNKVNHSSAMIPLRAFHFSPSILGELMRVLIAVVVLCLMPEIDVHGAELEKAIGYDRQIRPLLSNNCISCHGPGKQEAGLRLDGLEGSQRMLDSGSRAIVPGDPGTSELIRRISSTDPDVVMPPPHSNKILKERQKDLLRQWISQGATYEKHWSFRPIVKNEIPADTVSGGNPIDFFLESRLRAEGLAINPPADRPTLIRRLSFALTGLPPTLAEVDAFIGDTSPDAYEKLVDRLLGTLHFGEEMARHWLDVARYADTHGLHLDNERQMWAYRDWVVKAFNDNLSFDKFTVEQIAGDLLPNATRDQKVATGFSRCNVTTSEGGSINEELVFRYAVDRTATMIQAWMGLTGQCAVCHDHKFDPLSAREFYSLYAFFNSAADPGFDGNSLLTAPTLKLPLAPQEMQLSEFDAQLPILRKTLDEVVAAVEYKDPATVEPKPEIVRIETIWLDDEFPPAAAVQSAGASIAWFSSANVGEVLSGQRSLERTAVGIGQDFYQSGSEPIEIPAGAEIFAHIWIDPVSPPKSVMLQFHTDGWKHRAVWGDSDIIPWGTPGTVERVVAGPLPEAGKWVKLSIAADKVGLPAGTKITGFALTQFDGHVRWDLVGLTASDDPTTNVSRSFSAWWKSQVVRKDHNDIPEPIRGLVKEGPEKTTKPEDVDRVRRHWLENIWNQRPDALKNATRELTNTQKSRNDLDSSIISTFVFNDMPTLRDSFVMLRGAYTKPGEKVDRGTPAFLPALPIVEGVPLSRLELANWLMSPEHPLTARVAANRLWQQFFGIGLVKTSDDFGSQGEDPSHAELLEWLAIFYREIGWDTKKFVRQLVLSNAFKRSGVVSEDQLLRDPENRLYSRGPRFRLDAEQIRDNAIALSGLLSKTMGGRGVRPYQPDNIWEPVGFAGSNTQTYKRDTGESLYRRSLYVFLKRTAPPPFMVNFDGSNREQFCSGRERSNTPLQSLQLLNDVQHVEAARALAAQTLALGGSDTASRITWAFRTVLSRIPEADESTMIAEQLALHLARYAVDQESATKLISIGESKPPTDVPPGELAAWTLVTNMLLNLDETLTRN